MESFVSGCQNNSAKRRELYKEKCLNNYILFRNTLDLWLPAVFELTPLPVVPFMTSSSGWTYATSSCPIYDFQQWLNLRHFQLSHLWLPAVVELTPLPVVPFMTSSSGWTYATSSCPIFWWILVVPFFTLNVSVYGKNDLHVMEFNFKMWVLGNELNCRSPSMNLPLFNLSAQLKSKTTLEN